MSTRLGFLSIKLPRTGNYQKSANISMSPLPPTAHIESVKFTIPVSITMRGRKARTRLPVIRKLSLVNYNELVPTYSGIELPPTQPGSPGQGDVFTEKNKRTTKSRDWTLVGVWTCQMLSWGLQGMSSLHLKREGLRLVQAYSTWPVLSHHIRLLAAAFG